jgi:hypothetical protein
VEAHEAALLGRVRRLLGGVEQPLTERLGVVRRGLLADDPVGLTELAEDLDPGVGPLARLEAPERVLALARLGDHLARERADQLAAPAGFRLAHDLERGRRLLDRLDRAAGIGERDRHAGHERRALEPRPLVLVEIRLGCHVRIVAHPHRRWTDRQLPANRGSAMVPRCGS